LIFRQKKGALMGFKNKIVAVCLFGIVGLGILSVGTCGHNRFSSIAGPELAAHVEREPAEIKGKLLRS
jgi:hypothetical protein